MVEIGHNQYEENGLIVTAVENDKIVNISIMDMITNKVMYTNSIKRISTYSNQIEDMVDDALFIYQNRKAFKRKDQLNK